MSRRAPRCPDCPGAPAGVPIVYGLPSAETFDAAERGEFVLGGCEVFRGPTPRWACPNCRDYLDWSFPSPYGAFPVPAAHLRVGTWNLRSCPHPGSIRGEQIAQWQHDLAADIWLLTEVHEEWGWWRHSSWAASPPRGGDTPELKRWAGIQTHLPMTELYVGRTDRPAAEESLCVVRIHLPESVHGSSMLVACSVLPWGGAGKSWPGLPEKYLNRQQAFVLEHHAGRIAEAWDGTEPIVWGGDFNQELRNLTPQRNAAGYRIAGTIDGIGRLRAAFERLGLHPLTEHSEHLHPEAPSIDHLAVSRAFARGEAVVHRPHDERGSLLSDHAAYTADIWVGPAADAPVDAAVGAATG